MKHKMKEEQTDKIAAIQLNNGPGKTNKNIQPKSTEHDTKILQLKPKVRINRTEKCVKKRKENEIIYLFV